MQTALEILATCALIAVMLAFATLVQGNEAPLVVPAGAVFANEPAHPQGPLDWVIIGAGASPASTQVTIEGDVSLVANTFAGVGQVLFSGGSTAACVQVLDRDLPEDPLFSQLAALFAPRSGRRSSYRPPDFPATPATAGAVLRVLATELDRAHPADLLVWASGHGEVGEAAADNYLALWAGGRLTPVDLAAAVDRGNGKRTVRIVATTCFSGGFGEIAFRGGDASNGAAEAPRCGLFASPWDLESSGCDPNPDRRLHHGYAAYFLPALRGRSRDGKRLPDGGVDYDGDGSISLLEAHTHVRIASPTADVPTTTSERWLRAVAPLAGAVSPTDLPEDQAVIVALSLQLGISDPRNEAAARHKAAQAAVDAADIAVKELQRVEDDAYFAVSAELLARWPILDDPWHPLFAVMMRSQKAAIAAHVSESAAWQAWRRATAATDAALDRRDVVRIRRAKFERLQRAVKNVELAGRLTAKGGADWLYWRQLLRCERFVPSLHRGTAASTR